MNTIKVKGKSVYGNVLLYVVSDHKAAVETLTGKKTVDKKDIAALRALGFTIEMTGESPE